MLDEKESNVSRQCHDVLESHILGCSSGFPEWLWSHGKWKINNMRHEYFQLQEKFSHLSFDESKDRANRLAIRMPNWLGDIIMSIPVILAIKNARPDLRISLFCMKQYSEWLRSLAIAEEIIELPLKNSRIEYFLKFLSYRRHFFDAQLVLTNSLRGDVESFLVGAEKRFGMVKGYGRPLLTNFYHSEKEASLRTHQTILWGNMLNHFGLKQILSLSPLAVSKTKQKLPVDLITIGIAPGSMNTPDKRLPVCEWVKICKSIQQEFINLQIKLRIELFGTPKDEGICNEIMECSEDVNLHDYSGKTTLVQLSDKFKKLDLLICNDSGAMHLANILGVPVAAIFSVTNKDVTGPIFDAPKFLFDFDREKPDSKFSVNFVTKLSQFFFNLNEIRKVE